MTKDKLKTKTVEDLQDVLNDLDQLMQDRINENNTTGTRQGIMCKQHTHTYMYYRDKVWEAQRLVGKLKN